MKILRIKDGEGQPYLTRLVLFRRFGYKIYLHKIHQSDHDRALHDHPWPFISFLLWGSYIEEEHPGPPYYVAIRLRKRVRWFNMRLRPDVPHRLELDRGVVWTLVFAGRWCREWGFVDASGWHHHSEFIGESETSEYD